MAEEGVESADFLKFLAEDSGNVAGDGNFSVQVLSEALKVWNLDVVSVNSPDAKDAKANPLAQNAFILNLGSHWFTVRRIGGTWGCFSDFYGS
jgi:ataxin-3